MHNITLVLGGFFYPSVSITCSVNSIELSSAYRTGSNIIGFDCVKALMEEHCFSEEQLNKLKSANFIFNSDAEIKKDQYYIFYMTVAKLGNTEISYKVIKNIESIFIG